MKHRNKTFVLQSTLFIVCLELAGAGKHYNIEYFLVSAVCISQQEASVGRENPALQPWAVPPRCPPLKDVTLVALHLTEGWKGGIEVPSLGLNAAFYGCPG